MQFEQLFGKAMEDASSLLHIHLITDNSFPDFLDIRTGKGRTAAVVLSLIAMRMIVGAGTLKKTQRRLGYCLPMIMLMGRFTSD